MPRRNASTHAMKIRPVTIVTDSPSELNQSTPVIAGNRGADIAEPVFERHDDRRAEQRPEHRAHAADQRHQDDQARHGPVGVAERLEAEHEHLQRTGQPRQPRRQNERQQLEAIEVS